MDTLLRGVDSAELPADREGQLRGPTDLSCPAADPQVHDYVRVRRAEIDAAAWRRTEVFIPSLEGRFD